MENNSLHLLFVVVCDKLSKCRLGERDGRKEGLCQLHDEAQDGDLEVGPRRVQEEGVAQQAKVAPRGLDQHGLLVRERIEACAACVNDNCKGKSDPRSQQTMVCTGPAVANTPKGELGVTHVEQRAVDSNTATRSVANHLDTSKEWKCMGVLEANLLLDTFVGAEHIQRERLGAGVHKVDGIIDAAAIQ